MMSKDKTGKTKPILKPALTFFNSALTDLNSQRMQLNRSKGLAKYLAKSQKNIRELPLMDTTLGMMSFSLYMLRFLSNLGLLAQLMIAPQENTDSKRQKELYYSLFNDSLWSVVNMTQFFWLSYRNSNTAGLGGLQLETLAQLIDLLVMIIRYQQDKEDYYLRYQQASDDERVCLAIERRNKELHTLRSLATSLSIALVFGLFSFSIVAVPISPVISAIVLISSFLKVLTDVERDKQLIQQMKLKQTTPLQLDNEQRAMTAARLNDVNQIILNSVFLPIGIFLLVTSPLPIAILASVSMLLTHYLITQLINTSYLPEPTPDAEEHNLCENFIKIT